VKPRVGISSCLLGQAVRYDGGHKRDRWIVERLGRKVTFVPVCPEVELGMGVPREPIHLEGKKLVSESGIDWTQRMRRYAEARVRALEKLGLSGYVLKSKSPSCGREGVPAGGRKASAGAFASILMKRMPDLPVEDEAGLRSPAARRSFLLRVLAYASGRRVGRAAGGRGS
jgi:uncharacterized protein YbbK (DUF523 family)